MQLRDILTTKGHHIVSVAPQATLADVVTKLVAHNIGSLIVLDQDRMVGIITERDLLRAYALKRTPFDELRVADYMSQKLVTGQLNDDVGDAMGVLTEHRIRHLPILDDGELAGVISIGDLVKAQYNELRKENHYLKSYIQS